MSNEREACAAWRNDFFDRTSREPTPTEAWYAALKWQAARQSADDEFKNFHRLLCERFGYSHDEKHWKRDQLSLIEWIAARQSAGATGHEPVTRNEAPKEMLERMHREFKLMGPFEQRAFLECVYSAAPIGDNGAKAWREYFGDKHPGDVHQELLPAYQEIECLKSQPAGGSGSAAWDYGNRLVDDKLDPSYAQPSNEPIPQHLEGQSYDAWDAFQKHPESQMSNSDDFWPIWRDAWDAAREQPAESKRVELTFDEISEVWTGVSGRPLYKGSVADSFARALLAHTSGKGE